ncbi:MAG: hypothetical protein EON47_14545 [Acetobacteraceae bacterium]|nr:MAG: hypothetical protein EON47_14545 [Acetobacteraceae bacterium]
MQTQMLGHGILALATLAALVWAEAVPADVLLRAAELVLVWAGLTTLVVGVAGAWVALGRSRRPAPAPRGGMAMQRARPPQ